MKQNLDKSISVKIICLNSMQILTHGFRPNLCVKNDTFNYALFWQIIYYDWLRVWQAAIINCGQKKFKPYIPGSMANVGLT